MAKFTSETAPRKQPNSSKNGHRVIMRQILTIQERLYQDCLDKEVSAAARAQSARAFDVLEERKRILRMKPKPRDIDVSDKVNARKAKRLPPPLILEAPPSETDSEPSKESLSNG